MSVRSNKNIDPPIGSLSGKAIQLPKTAAISWGPSPVSITEIDKARQARRDRSDDNGGSAQADFDEEDWKWWEKKYGEKMVNFDRTKGERPKRYVRNVTESY